LAEMHRQAVEMRARIMSDYNRDSIGLSREDNLSEGLVHQTEQLGFPEPIRDQLLPIVKEVGMDPLSLPPGGNRYFRMENGTISVNIAALRKTKAELKKF